MKPRDGSPIGESVPTRFFGGSGETKSAERAGQDMMDQMIAISAIVPTYNRAGYLAEALKSLQAQTLAVKEIIVWDDGSVDGTASIMQEFVRKDPSCRYFRAENGGKSRALNRAMSEARGNAIWICDDDDLCRPDAAENMVAAMRRTGAAVVGGRYRRFGIDPASGEAVGADPGYWPDLSRGSILRHLLEDIFLFQNATLATRAAYDRVGPFREDLPRSIDYDMIVRLASRHGVGFVDAVVFEQRKHDGARGPAAARHDAVRMDDIWLEADQRVFRDFRSVLPLSLYEAMFDVDGDDEGEGDGEGEGGALVQRVARLQRACVYARRDLWPLALEDFEAAADLASKIPLKGVERAICIRAMAGKHRCHGVLAPEIAGWFAKLARRGANAAEIVKTLGQGLRWRCREAAVAGDYLNAARFMHRAARFGGMKALRARASGHSAPDGLLENAELPASAYQW